MPYTNYRPVINRCTSNMNIVVWKHVACDSKCHRMKNGRMLQLP